ncbi:MAG TPA: DNA-binding protein [Bacteroidales bacterium]|nr:DNA-binding protein [Bacteroidales bacterium]
MNEFNLNDKHEDIYSQAIRAGKRTYFFDVKQSKSNEMYLTVTESKRHFSSEQGKFEYEKHKIFLFKEDFEKFSEGLKEAILFIENGSTNENLKDINRELSDESESFQIHSEVKFEDLD